MRIHLIDIIKHASGKLSKKSDIYYRSFHMFFGYIHVGASAIDVACIQQHVGDGQRSTKLQKINGICKDVKRFLANYLQMLKKNCIFAVKLQNC